MTHWTTACKLTDIEPDGVRRFDLSGRSFAIYRTETDELFCTDGFCSHEQVHLSDGLMMDYEIECPKHSGIFDIRSGEAKRLPACVNLQTYPARLADGQVQVQVG